MLTRLESLRAKVSGGQIVRSRRRWVRRTVVAIVLATMAVVGQSTAAYADVFAEGPGVRARGNWTWHPRDLTGIYLAVRDTACDGTAVGVRLRIYHVGGGYEDTRLRTNGNGCNTVLDWSGLAWEDAYRIAGVRVVGCRTAGPVCFYSPYHDNPTTN